jgi:hypothetical protein
VEQAPSITHTVGYRFNQPISDLTRPVTLLTYGAAKLVMAPDPGHTNQFKLVVENSGTSVPWPPPDSQAIPVGPPHSHNQLIVVTDPNLNQIVITWEGKKVLGHYVAPSTGPAVVQTTPANTGGPKPVVTVSELARPAPDMTLCQSLLRGGT